jgi:hypothetical protein
VGTPDFQKEFMNIKKHHIRESHERQFNGEDYQQVAQDICDRIPDATVEDYPALCVGPEPECDCGFCAKAEWWD